MLQARVTQIENFRIWQEEEALELNWILARLRSETSTERMEAGTAFHKALELADREAEVETLTYGPYRFDFNCDCDIVIPTIKEMEFTKQYGDLSVVGHTDSIIGNEVTDYKTTAQFDPDRYMEGYQWRFYLDMTGCDSFRWKIFVIKDFGPDNCYEVTQSHTLVQKRYPGMHEDCENLAREYCIFADQYLAEVTQ